MKVVLLAAGKSTRLLPLTLKTPKPMLRVGAKPIMEYVLNNFVRKGFKEFLITTHYLSETIMSYFGNGRKYGCKIEYSY